MRSENIKLHIEELMLDGFAAANRYLIVDSVECELAMLFAVQCVPHSLTQGGEITNLDGGAFEMVQGLNRK